jgi:hypothetical protein
MTLASRGTSASVEFQGQEVLSLWDALCPSTRESIMWRHCKNYTLWANSFERTYKNQKIFLVHEWCISEETSLVISRLLCANSTRRSMSKSGTRKDYLLRLRSSATNTFKCLIKDSPLWRGIISTNLKKPEVQYDHKKGMLSNQPQLMRVTPTALLGSWVLKPIKDMMSLGTDFETHANWQGCIEEPAAKYFVAKKAHTIALSKAWGTHWNRYKCKEHLGNPPEAVVRQARINFDSQVWESLEDSLSKLYCIDIAEAYIPQESVSSRILCEKKRYDLQLPNGCWHEKASAKGGTGKENRYWFQYQVPTSVLLWENVWSVPEIWGGTYKVVPWSTKGMRKQDKK